MTPFEIPLSPEPQRFSIDLAGKVYRLRVLWCKESACWCLDITDSDGVDLLLGAPMVTGLDLLRQHQHLGIPGGLLVQTDHDAEVVPTFDSLGVTGRLYFVVLP